MAYTLNDEFTTNDAAPISSPRTCEPGPGTLTVVQNDGQFSISSGTLDLPGQSTPAWEDLGFYSSDGISRANGTCLVADITNSAWFEAALGFASSAGLVSSISSLAHAMQFPSAAGYVQTEDGAEISRAFPTSATGRLMIVLGTAHTKYILHDGTNWYLLWISSDTTSTLYPVFQDYDFQGTLDNFRIFDQGSPYDTDTGLADYYDNSPTVNDTWTGSADLLLHFTVDTLPSSGAAIRVAFRKQDANNLWYVYVNESGNVYLYERISSGNNNRGGDQIASAGDEIKVIADGSNIRLIVNDVVAAYYTSAGFTSATDGQYGGIGGTDGGTISDLGSWPHDLTGDNAPDAEETSVTQTINAAHKELFSTALDATVSPGAVTASAVVADLTTTAHAGTVTPGATTVPASIANLTTAGQSALVYSTGEVNANAGLLTTSGEQASVRADPYIRGGVGSLTASGETGKTNVPQQIQASHSELTVGKPIAGVDAGSVTINGVTYDLTLDAGSALWSGSVAITAGQGALRTFGEHAAVAEGTGVQFVKTQYGTLAVVGESATIDMVPRIRVTWVEFGIPLSNDRMINAKVADLEITDNITLVLTDEDILPRMNISDTGAYVLVLADSNARLVAIRDTGRYILRISDM